MDLTKGDSNPMDNVSFFDYPQSTEKRRVPQHQISTMFPICNRVRLAVLIPLLCCQYFCGILSAILPHIHCGIDHPGSMPECHMCNNQSVSGSLRS